MIKLLDSSFLLFGGYISNKAYGNSFRQTSYFYVCFLSNFTQWHCVAEGGLA
jgi:hypothetical protein